VGRTDRHLACVDKGETIECVIAANAGTRGLYKVCAQLCDTLDNDFVVRWPASASFSGWQRRQYLQHRDTLCSIVSRACCSESERLRMLQKLSPLSVAQYLNNRVTPSEELFTGGLDENVDYEGCFKPLEAWRDSNFGAGHANYFSDGHVRGGSDTERSAAEAQRELGKEGLWGPLAAVLFPLHNPLGTHDTPV